MLYSLAACSLVLEFFDFSPWKQERTASVECSTQPCLLNALMMLCLLLCASVRTIRVPSHREGWLGFPAPLHHSITPILHYSSGAFSLQLGQDPPGFAGAIG